MISMKINIMMIITIIIIMLLKDNIIKKASKFVNNGKNQGLHKGSVANPEH